MNEYFLFFHLPPNLFNILCNLRMLPFPTLISLFCFCLFCVNFGKRPLQKFGVNTKFPTTKEVSHTHTQDFIPEQLFLLSKQITRGESVKKIRRSFSLSHLLICSCCWLLQMIFGERFFKRKFLSKSVWLR